jgi:hypothetical protein
LYQQAACIRRVSFLKFWANETYASDYYSKEFDVISSFNSRFFIYENQIDRLKAPNTHKSANSDAVDTLMRNFMKKIATHF